ncbi:MAG: anthranilate synthase component II [Bacteroidia bacterium]
MRLLFIDNFDSFSFNIVHALQGAGAEVEVRTHLELDDVALDDFQGIVVGPGPGTPEQSGPLLLRMKEWQSQKPMLGICLGMQAMGVLAGAPLGHAPCPVHGKPALIRHKPSGLFRGLPQNMQVGRYHSLMLHPWENEDLQPLAFSEDGVCMAVSWNSGLQVHYGVQFHPESILTPWGPQLLANWMTLLQSDSK